MGAINLAGGMKQIKGDKEKVAAQKAAAAAAAATSVQSIGTEMDLKVTFFPNVKDDLIVYYKNLHMFKTRSWFSIGLKPRAKDLKTVIEDFR